MAVSKLVTVVAAVVVFAGSLLPSAVADCPTGDGTINCLPCRTRGTRLTGLMNNLPRMTTSLAPVSSNLGSFNLFENCSVHLNDLQQCSFIDMDSAGSSSGFTSSSTNTEPVQGYFQGAIGWGIFGLTFASFSLLFSTAWCIGRFGGVCCPRLTTCGKRFPTSKRTFRGTCGLGFTPLGKTLEAGFGYATGQKVVRAWMMVTFLLVVVTVIVGNQNGAQKMRPALKVAINATQALMDNTQALEEPVAVHLTNIASKTLTQGATHLYRVATRHTDIFQMANNTAFLAKKVRDVLPFTTVIETNTIEIGHTLNELRDAAQGSLVEVEALNTTTLFTVLPPLEVMREENLVLDHLRQIADAHITATIPKLDRAEVLRTDLLNSVTGSLPVAQLLNETIDTLPRNDWVYQYALDPAAASLEALESGNMFGNAFTEERFELWWNLQLIQDALQRARPLLIDAFGRTAIHNSNVQRDRDTGVFDEVDSFLRDAKIAADNVTLELNIETLDNLTIALGKYNATPAASVLNDLQATLRLHLPERFGVIGQEILKIWTAGAVPPPGWLAAEQSYVMNATHMTVPDCFHLLVELSDALNITLPPVLVDAQVFDDELEAFAAVVEFELENTTSYIQAYRDSEAAARAIDFTSRRNVINASILARDAIEEQYTRTTARNARDTLAVPQARTSQDVVDMLFLMWENIGNKDAPPLEEFPLFENIDKLLEQARATLQDFSLGRCDFTGAVGIVCEDDSQCSGGFCRRGQARCERDYLKSCDDDAQCQIVNRFDRCLFHKSDFTVAKRALRWYWQLGRPVLDVEPEIAHMAHVHDVVLQYPNLANSPRADLLAYGDSLGVLPIDPTHATLNQLEVDTSPETLQIARTYATAANLNETSRLVDAEAPLPAMAAYNASLTSYYDNADEVFFCEGWSEAGRQWWTVDLPAHIDAMTPDAMAERRENEGVHAMLETINGFVDGFFDYGRQWCDVSPTINMANDTADIRARLESLSADEFSNGGPVNYLLNFLYANDRDRFVSTTDGNRLGAFVNKRWRSGREQAWGPEAGSTVNRTCVTTQCIEASIDEWFNSTNGAGFQFDVDTVVNVHAGLFAHSSVTAATGGDLLNRFQQQFADSLDRMEVPPSVAFSTYESAYAALYAFPIIAVGMGFLGALCMCKNIRRLQRWPALCGLVLLFLLVPATFWIGGGIYFPLGIVFSDTCASLENVVWAYAEGSTDWLCEAQLGGVWRGDGDCELDLGALASSTVTVNLNRMTRAVLEGCHTHPGEFRRFYTDVAAAFRDVPLDTTTRNMDSFGRLCHPHPEPELAIREAARFLPTNVEALLDDLSNTFNCETIHPAVIELRDTICCELGDAVLYHTLSWYLLGVIMCMCGVPSTLLGLKRFPNELWGPEFEKSRVFQPKYLKQHWQDQPPLEDPPPPPTDDPLDQVDVYEEPLPFREDDRASEDLTEEEEAKEEPSAIIGEIEVLEEEPGLLPPVAPRGSADSGEDQPLLDDQQPRRQSSSPAPSSRRRSDPSDPQPPDRKPSRSSDASVGRQTVGSRPPSSRASSVRGSSAGGSRRPLLASRQGSRASSIGGGSVGSEQPLLASRQPSRASSISGGGAAVQPLLSSRQGSHASLRRGSSGSGLGLLADDEDDDGGGGGGGGAHGSAGEDVVLAVDGEEEKQAVVEAGDEM